MRSKMIRLDEYLEIMRKLLDFGDISEYVSNIVKEEIITTSTQENNRNDEIAMNIAMLLCGVQ